MLASKASLAVDTAAPGVVIGALTSFFASIVSANVNFLLNIALHLTLPSLIAVVRIHFVPFQVILSFASIFLPFLVHSTDALYLFVVGNVLLSTPSIKDILS